MRLTFNDQQAPRSHDPQFSRTSTALQQQMAKPGSY
jgi:hypothetical protein